MLLRILALAGLLLATAPAAMAQAVIVDARPTGPDDSFNESYDDSAAVSGSPLVGLVLGDALTELDNSAVVVAPADGDGLCVRVSTRDGRFYAANRYAMEPGSAGQLVRIAPLARRFVAQLDGYAADDVAVRAFASADADCAPAGAANLPLLSGSVHDTLILLANGKSQPALAALYAGVDAEAAATADPVVSADCQPAAGGPNIAYDLVCRLPLPAALAGATLLKLEFSDGFGYGDPYYFSLLLPAASGAP